MTTSNRAPLIVLVGQTASGKTHTAIELALRFNGEVVSADSRQVYTRLNIGTDKVMPHQMRGIKHHLIDIIDPVCLLNGNCNAYSVADFVRDARHAIDNIHARGKVPILAGGTMLYIDTLLERIYVPDVPPNPHLRRELEEQSAAMLFAQLEHADQKRAETLARDGQRENKRRIIRALEIIESIGKVPVHNQVRNNPHKSPYNTLWLGLYTEPSTQREKIHARNEQMLAHGLLDEVSELLELGFTQTHLDTFGFEYKYPAMYIRQIPIIGNTPPTMEHTLSKMNSNTWRYAKKQRSWWRDRDEIQWHEPSDIDAITKNVENFLQSV